MFTVENLGNTEEDEEEIKITHNPKLRWPFAALPES